MTEETQWHRITIWGRKAEIVAQYLETGSRVFLEGQLQIKNWTDKDGIIRKSVEVQADEIRFLGGGPRRVETAAEAEEETEIPAIA
jgi:single-strand DNA-binding protein